MNKMRKTQSVGQGFRYPLPLGIGQFYNLTTFSQAGAQGATR